ncbi:MAG: hypothetical protein ACF8AM_23135 [Rhodopirellula sp. JB055]|uniref:hypothetical protein n=1 Tax=Rhodopirellula sp. JB055 TaxID=3342846 RepID=UPI00370B69D1
MVKPVLQAMVLADHVYQDRRSGKHVIAGTFTKIVIVPSQDAEIVEENGEQKQRLSGPVSRMGSPYLYLSLTGLRNEQAFLLQLVDLTEAKVLMEMNFKMKCSDPVQNAEAIIDMPLLPIPRKDGNYSIDLIWNGEQIGSWRITAELMSPREGSEQK